MPRMDEAAGMTPLTTVPGGATISRGRNMPAVLGISSRSTDRTHRATTEDVKESVLLMAPLTCGAVPVKSARSSSPATVISTCKRTGGPPTPSLSI